MIHYQPRIRVLKQAEQGLVHLSTADHSIMPIAMQKFLQVLGDLKNYRLVTSGLRI